MEDSVATAPCKNGSLATAARNSSDVSSGVTTGSASNEGKRESTDNEQRIITKRKVYSSKCLNRVTMVTVSIAK